MIVTYELISKYVLISTLNYELIVTLEKHLSHLCSCDQRDCLSRKLKQWEHCGLLLTTDCLN